MPTVSVSVIVPAFNAAKTLPRTLESIARQTAFPDQVIVVDDGSTDDTPRVLEQWRERLPLLIVRQANSGAGKARNVGARHATNDLLAYIDADDEYLPHAIEKLYELMLKAPDAVCAFGDASHISDVIVESAACRRLTTPGVHYADWHDPPYVLGLVNLTLLGQLIPAGAYIVRRDAFIEAGGCDETLKSAIDRDMFLNLAMRSTGLFVFTWERLCLIHYTEGSLSSLSNRVRHSLDQLRVLKKFQRQHRMLEPQTRKTFSTAVKRSTNSALYWAGDAGPLNVLRTATRLPIFNAATLPLLGWNIARSAGRKSRDVLLGRRVAGASSNSRR